MKTRLQVLLGLFALVLLTGAACAANAPADKKDMVGDKKDSTADSSGTDAMQKKEPVRIGWLGPLTGDLASIGKDARIAAELATEEINAAGGINGRMIELVVDDAKCNPKDATLAGNKMISVDGVRIINGAACSGETLAVAPIAQQNRAVLLSYCSSAPSVTEAGDFIFRSYPSDAYQGAFAADYAYNDLGARRVAVLAVQTDWGQGIKQTFESRFKELGGIVVYSSDHAQDVTDLKTDLTKVKNSNADLVYFPSLTKASIIGLRQAQELRINLKMLGGDTWDDTTIHESGVANDIQYVVPKTDLAQEWQDKMKAKGANITACAPRAYDNMYLFADIIGRVGSDPVEVKDALYQVKDFAGVAGPISIDENGDLASSDYTVKTVKNEKPEVLK